MLRTPFTAELFDEVLFFHRPLPPEDADFIQYIEEQISELLFSDEKLSDVVYRFGENPSELLIAVARKKTLTKKPLPAGRLCYRIPVVIDIWLKARHVLKPEPPSFVYAVRGSDRYLLCADARNLYRVLRLKNSAGSGQEMTAFIGRVREKYFPENAKAVLLSQEPFPEALKNGLSERSVEVVPVTFSHEAISDKAIFEQWDFRQDLEIESQEMIYRKNQVVRACAITAAGIATLWLLLAGGAALAGTMEERAMKKWGALSSSLKEITYLQKETHDLITEITMCRKLSEKRTERATVLQCVAATRPAEVFLDELRIGEVRKARADKNQPAPAAGDVLMLKGYSIDGKGMTGWMEQLMKSKLFSAVNLLSMEKKGAVYHFQIECTR